MPDLSSPLNGRWQMVRAEFNGEAAPELVAQRTDLEFNGASYTVRFDGSATDCGTFDVGIERETKTMILHGQTGPNAGRTLSCIYQLVGDRLRICYGLDGCVPTEFTTSARQQRYLATYRRI